MAVDGDQNIAIKALNERKEESLPPTTQMPSNFHTLIFVLTYWIISSLIHHFGDIFFQESFIIRLLGLILP